MSTFRRARLDQLPEYLGGPEGEALEGALGDAQDAELPLLRAAAVSDLPDLCPDDALADPRSVGGWFQIERFPGESDTSYRARLVDAWPTWEQAGAPTSVESQVLGVTLPTGVDSVTAVETPDFYGGPGDGQHRGWVVIVPTAGQTLLSELLLGDWTLGSASTVLALNATAALIRSIKRAILKWKAAWCYPVGLIFVYPDGADAGPVLGYGTVNIDFGTTKPLLLGSFKLGGARTIRVRIGRTLGDTITTLPDTLGGYEV